MGDGLRTAKTNEETNISLFACQSQVETLQSPHRAPQLSKFPFELSRVRLNVHLYGPCIVLGNTAYNPESKAHDISFTLTEPGIYQLEIRARVLWYNESGEFKTEDRSFYLGERRLYTRTLSCIPLTHVAGSPFRLTATGQKPRPKAPPTKPTSLS